MHQNLLSNMDKNLESLYFT